MDIERLISETIPIYTYKNPHPINRKPDCNLTKDYKELQRNAMRAELQAVIAKYIQKSKRVNGTEDTVQRVQ